MTRITYRFKPCPCGCNGSDPWHRQSYNRNIKDIVEEFGTAETRDIGKKQYKRTGWVRLPFTTKPVRVVDIDLWTRSAHWVVDWESITFDK